MDQMKIIKRAWSILWSYRALWVIGILLALTSAGGSSGGGSNGGAGQNGGSGQMPFNAPGELGEVLRSMSAWVERTFQHGMEREWIGIAIALGCVVILLGIVATVVQYVSKVALIRMVDQYEQTGQKVTWRQGFRLGWTRHAWRLFLIDLVVFLPVFLGVLVLIGCAALPLLVGSVGGNDPTPLGIIATIGLAFLVIFVLIIVVVAMGMLMELVYREAVLNDAGVFEALRRGWHTLRANFKDVFVLWLITVGLQIALGIAGIIVFFLLLAIAAVFGGGIGVGLYFLVKAIGTVTAAWITAGIVGGLIFILLIGVPLTFVEGLSQTFFSTVWTLTHRELNLQRAVLAAPLEPDAPQPDVVI